jgi:hypothetical protein
MRSLPNASNIANQYKSIQISWNSNRLNWHDAQIWAMYVNVPVVCIGLLELTMLCISWFRHVSEWDWCNKRCPSTQHVASSIFLCGLWMGIVFMQVCFSLISITQFFLYLVTCLKLDRLGETTSSTPLAFGEPSCYVTLIHGSYLVAKGCERVSQCAATVRKAPSQMNHTS